MTLHCGASRGLCHMLTDQSLSLDSTLQGQKLQSWADRVL
jgi:hypothetical protein